jgi:WD40 repeat protein
LATGKLRHKIHEPSHSPTALAFSPDSATLASGGGDKTVRLWDTATGGKRQLLKGHGDWVCSLDFSDDGKTIASASCDWAFHRGRDAARFEGPAHPVESQWKLWDATSGELLRTATEPGRILSLSVAPDGAWLACGLGNDLRVYDLRAKTPSRVVTTHDALVTGVAFMPDGKGIVSSAHDHVVICSNAADGQLQWRLPGQREQVNSVALSRDGRLLVTGASDERFAKRLIKAGAPGIAPGAIRLWNAQTGQLLRRLGDPAEQVLTVAVSPGGKHVVSGGTGNTRAGVANSTAGAVRVWDAETGAPVWSASDHTAEVLAVAFAPDGSSLAAADAGGSVVMRDAKSGRTLFTLPGHEGGATSVAFAPSGEIVVCGQGHGGARIWNAQSGRLLHTCKAKGSQAKYLSVDRLITSVAIFPDGRTFAECIASMGNTYSEPLRFWDIHTGRLNAERNDKRAMERRWLPGARASNCTTCEPETNCTGCKGY